MVSEMAQSHVVGKIHMIKIFFEPFTLTPEKIPILVFILTVIRSQKFNVN